MARLTVEDCLEKVDNRYDLVLLAGKRTRQLSRSALSLFTDEDDDVNRLEKPTVVALREIAAGLVTEQNVDSLAAGYSEEENALVAGQPEPEPSEPEVTAEPTAEPDAAPKPVEADEVDSDKG